MQSQFYCYASLLGATRFYVGSLTQSTKISKNYPTYPSNRFLFSLTLFKAK
ncbi:hypothetical protein RchiOBHm_Chr7g0226571 [Rosa chinensis]|uniref:Uncharacterized protein n=1 Tax=Rosa chinensis TaxID=74649 RepID=A0A2P6PEE7_ROSCH|nr:hypothetical protein RchiOBHm_Chr7g0226571 [Rosa chinensis]